MAKLQRNLIQHAKAVIILGLLLILCARIMHDYVSEIVITKIPLITVATELAIRFGELLIFVGPILSFLNLFDKVVPKKKVSEKTFDKLKVYVHVVVYIGSSWILYYFVAGLIIYNNFTALLMSRSILAILSVVLVACLGINIGYSEEYMKQA